MPAARRPRPAYPQTARCRYVDDGGGRCRRVATVSGGFCRQCAVALELDLERGSGADRLIGTMDRILARGARDPALSQLGAFFGGVLGATLIHRAPPAFQQPLRQAASVVEAQVRARARAAAAAQPPPGAPRAAPPPPKPPTAAEEKRAAILAARVVMGFEPDEKITVELVKERKRALAGVFHPDRQHGSTKQMQRVNGAADVLLAALAKG